MIWAFLAGCFIGLLVASQINSHELDAAHKRADNAEKENTTLRAENRRMETVCRRAYEHMNEAPRFRSVEELEAERLLMDCGYTGEVEV